MWLTPLCCPECRLNHPDWVIVAIRNSRLVKGTVIHAEEKFSIIFGGKNQGWCRFAISWFDRAGLQLFTYVGLGDTRNLGRWRYDIWCEGDTTGFKCILCSVAAICPRFPDQKSHILQSFPRIRIYPSSPLLMWDARVASNLKRTLFRFHCSCPDTFIGRILAYRSRIFWLPSTDLYYPFFRNISEDSSLIFLRVSHQLYGEISRSPDWMPPEPPSMPMGFYSRVP